MKQFFYTNRRSLQSPKKNIQDFKFISSGDRTAFTLPPRHQEKMVKGFSVLKCLLSNSKKAVFHLPTIKLQIYLPTEGPVHDFVSLASLTPIVSSFNQTDNL